MCEPGAIIIVGGRIAYMANYMAKYYTKNADAIKVRHAKYYTSKASTNITCECGSTTSKKHLARHLRTDKHKKVPFK